MYRIRLMIVVAVVVMATTACWPQYGAGPDRQSYNPGESTLTIHTVGSMLSVPSWRAYLPAGTSSPVVTAEGVFVTSDSNVYALDRSSGDSLWTATVNVGYPPDFRSLGAPLVRVDKSEVLVGTSRYQAGGTYDRSFLSLDARTGAKRGEASSVGESASLRGPRLADTGLSYLPGGSGTIPQAEVRDRDLGTRWGGAAQVGTPTLGLRSLYVAGGTEVSSYDTAVPCPLIQGGPSRACTPTWSVTLDGGARPVVIGSDASALYVGTTAGTLYAIKATTGATLWKTSLGSAVTQSPALADGVLYVPTASGSLAVVNAAGCGSTTCPVRWTGITPASISAQPAVAGGVVYAGSSDGSLTAFDATGCNGPTCRPVWAGSTTGLGTASPVTGLAIAFGALYAGVDQGVTMFH